MVIHKQVISIVDSQVIPDIKGIRRILSVGVQYDSLVIWFLRDEDETESHSVEILIHGTGHSFNPADIGSMDFMGTCLMANGQLVWHVWTRIL